VTIDTALFAALTGLVAGRVYPDVAPELAVRPYITYQQVGGDAVNFLSQSVPTKKNSRVQVNVWTATRMQATQLASQVEDALRMASALQTTVLGAPVATYEADIPIYGARQDFSFWT
jgi:hypothetical protein